MRYVAAILAVAAIFAAYAFYCRLIIECLYWIGG